RARAAQVEQWISIVNTHIDPVWLRQYVRAYVFPSTADGSPEHDTIAAALPKMEQQFTVMDRAVARTGHLAGDTFTLADMNFVPIPYYMGPRPEGSARPAGVPARAKCRERPLARQSGQATPPTGMPGQKQGEAGKAPRADSNPARAARADPTRR